MNHCGDYDDDDDDDDDNKGVCVMMQYCDKQNKRQ